MSEDLILYVDDDGKLREYDDTYDVTIHCESMKSQEKLLAKLESMNWIPVSKRLPNTNGLYLVTLRTGQVMIEQYHSSEKKFGKSYQPSYGGIDQEDDFDETRIKAWMPLPKPYKEDE